MNYEIIEKKICKKGKNVLSYSEESLELNAMKLDCAVIRALANAAEKYGGTVNLGRLSGVDPSCISRYLRGKVKSVSDENWCKLRKYLQTAGRGAPPETDVPVLEWRELAGDPGTVLRNGGAEQLLLRMQDMQMSPWICDRDLVVVQRKENLEAVPENKIVVAVFSAAGKGLRAVCRRVRKLNGCYWFFCDEPQGSFFQVKSETIVWVGVALRKICEL